MISNTILLKILSWYDANARQLPWRKDINPYYILVSEYMLQQTTVATVTPYFYRFIQQLPTINDLANAQIDEVKVLWQGLGYYRRAGFLHQCAQKIVNNFNGILPSTIDDLKSLPGVGEYTAAALGSIIYNIPILAVDGNIIRVLSRVLGLFDNKETLKNKLYGTPIEIRAGDVNQALMDIGSRICKPKNPLCNECPIKNECYAFKHDGWSQLPTATIKKEKPHKFGAIFRFYSKERGIFMEKRPPKGLLGGMVGLLTTPWDSNFIQDHISSFLKSYGLKIPTEMKVSKEVNHTFTHFHLTLYPYTIAWEHEQDPYDNGFWVNPANIHEYALPTLMKKCLK
jgi:A/G-specific adenine glycosylase